MEFFDNFIVDNEDISGNILHYFDPKDITSLLTLNKNIGEAIIKYYQLNGINRNDMPIFINCNNIIEYLQHYRSYITGCNFPKQPLWLFRSEDIKFNHKMEKFINIQFEREVFLTINHEPPDFTDSIAHWQQLNGEEKYLFWCCVTGTHPEINLNSKSVSLSALISKAYWHYPQSFVRHYLDVYFTGKYDLTESKKIAKREIEAELKMHNGEQFYTTNKLTNIFNNMTENDFNNMLTNNPQAAHICTIMGVNNLENFLSIIRKINFDQVIDNDKLENIKNTMGLENIETKDIMNQYKSEKFTVPFNESEMLKKILLEIEELEIENIILLKTTNKNYLTHMEKNYGKSDLKFIFTKYRK